MKLMSRIKMSSCSGTIPPNYKSFRIWVDAHGIVFYLRKKFYLFNWFVFWTGNLFGDKNEHV